MRQLKQGSEYVNKKIIRDMESCYLVIEGEAWQGFQQKMVLHNHIEGIMPVEMRQIDNSTQYYYQVTNDVSLRDYLNKNPITNERIQFIIEEMIALIQKSKVYLLEQDNFILDVDCIYINPKDGRLKLCFYEGYHEAVREQMLRITEFFMESIDYNDEKAVRITYAIYKCLREDACSFETILEILHKEGAECLKRPIAKTTEFVQSNERIMENVCVDNVADILRSNTRQEKHQRLYWIGTVTINSIAFFVILKARWIFYQYSNEINITKLLIACAMLLVINILFNQLCSTILRNHRGALIDTSLFDEMGDTIVLSNLHDIRYILKKENSNETISLTEYPFIVGASNDCVQGLAPYPGVSKQHIMIQKSEEGLSVKDLNSTNGTFLNGELLESQRDYKIAEEDKITLGEVTYQLVHSKQ